MCEICKWIEEYQMPLFPMRLRVPASPVSAYCNYESVDFKMKYCPKCGRRLKK